MLKSNPPMVVVGVPFGRWLGLESGALMNGTSGLIWRDVRVMTSHFSSPSATWGSSKNSKESVYLQIRKGLLPGTESQGTLILNFAASRTGRNFLQPLEVTKVFAVQLYWDNIDGELQSWDWNPWLSGSNTGALTSYSIPPAWGMAE